MCEGVVRSSYTRLYGFDGAEEFEKLKWMLAGHTIQAPGGRGGGEELTSANLNGVNYFWSEGRSGVWDMYGLYGFVRMGTQGRLVLCTILAIQ